MTVLTKLTGEQKEEKKGDNRPLVQENRVDSDVEVAIPRAQRCAGIAQTLTLWLFGLFVIAVTIPASIYLYKSYVAHQNAGRFHGWCRIPVDAAEAKPRILVVSDDVNADPFEASPKFSEMTFDDSVSDEIASGEAMQLEKLLADAHEQIQRFFDEMIDIDADDENVKIEVPRFGFNREGRFIHDFRSNYTVIVDAAGGRCFLTPLDQDLILPPSSFLDLLMKTVSGYYNRALDVVRENTRVVLPALDDTDYLGPLINAQCDGYPIYKLERMTSRIFKRSLDMATGGHFVEYTGNNVLELNIVNLSEAAGRPKP